MKMFLLMVSLLLKNTCMNGVFNDRTNHTYGHLTAIRPTKQNSRNQWFWMCRCVCGKEKEVFGGNLHSGHTVSCGCKKKSKKHGEGGAINGLTRSFEYQTLASVLQRCLNPKAKAYQRYGARGITVCEQWNSMEKFPAFLEYMGRRPTQFHSIDRYPNKEGNYEPGNVRWATSAQQTRNRKGNVWLTFAGETLCRKDMAIKYGISPSGLVKRLNNGWPLEKALTTPPRRIS